jgi:hypothetical protein
LEIVDYDFVPSIDGTYWFYQTPIGYYAIEKVALLSGEVLFYC